MSLSLKVPEISDKPLIIAETRPHKIADFIAKLHQANLVDTATALFDEIEILNRQKVSPEDRLRALEAYRPTVVDLCEQLAEHYCAAPLPLPEKAKTHATVAESLWLELSYGYKLALIDNQKKFSASKAKKHRTHRAARHGCPARTGAGLPSDLFFIAPQPVVGPEPAISLRCAAIAA